MKKYILTIIAMAIAAISYAQAPNTSISFINNPGDGSLVVRAYGSGKTKAVAKDMAERNAVRQIIFKGVNVPGNLTLSKPIVLNQNAETDYQDFFNAFFSDGGYYKSFVTLQDRKIASNMVSRNANMITVQVTVRVLRSELRSYLIQNNIIGQ